MKKSRFLKILAPIVALGLLMGALFTVSASATADEGATEAKAPEIISMNVEYGSELYLYYAVDKGDAEGAPKLEVLSDAEGTAVEYTVSTYNVETVHGKECYIFRTKGVAPKDLNKAQYVRAVVGEESGEIKSASVELYLYTRLYKNGFAAKTAEDGADYTRRNLYYRLLRYGHAAQIVLYAGQSYTEIGGSAIMISGADGLASGKFDADYVELKAAEVEGKTFSYWEVDRLSVFGELIETKRLGDGYEFVSAGDCAVITPVYDAEDISGVELWEENRVYFNQKNSAVNIGNSLGGYAVDPTDYKNNVLKFTPNGEKSIYATYKPDTTAIPNDANVAVLEFDLYLGGEDASGNITPDIEIYFYNPSYTSRATSISLFHLNGANIEPHVGGKKLNEEGKLEVTDTVEGATESGVKAGEWNRIRIEYRMNVADGVKTPEWKIFVNGALVNTFNKYNGNRYYATAANGETTGELMQSRVTAAKSITGATFSLPTTVAGGVVCIDNLKIEHIVE